MCSSDLYKALNLRRELQPLFAQGAYVPLQVTGAKADHVLAFARHHAQQWCVVVVPLLLVSLVEAGELPLGQHVWQDTAVTLPAGAPQQWQSAFGTKAVSGAASIQLADAFNSFPVALLTATTA